MELPDQVDTLDTVPQPYHRFYSEAEDDGGFTLDPDGLAGVVTNYDSLLGEKKKAASKVADLQKELKRFEGIDDPEAAREARKKLREAEDKLSAIEAGSSKDEVEELLQKRTERMREDHQAEVKAKAEAIKEREEELSKLRNELATRVIDSEVALAATTDGFVPEAAEDAVQAARRLFKMEDGKAVPRDADGQLVMGKDGDRPLTIKEWLESTRKSKPHWWKAQANGGGATGSESSGGGQTMSREAFEKLPPQKKSAFAAKVRAGEAQLTD